MIIYLPSCNDSFIGQPHDQLCFMIHNVKQLDKNTYLQDKCGGNENVEMDIWYRLRNEVIRKRYG